MVHAPSWFRSPRPDRLTALGLGFALLCVAAPTVAARGFKGVHYRGEGDVEYLRLLDTARRMFAPDPEFQNLSMLYMPAWNGLVEGPTWDAWWIQNSYGTTFGVLPFLQEPFITFLQNSQDLWFDQMGDGQRVGAAPPFNWVAPDGCLCDAARPGWIVYRQGDGRPHLHDWGMEFTAAGLLMQSELLLISRNRAAIDHYLPKLERCANFIETRRDPTNNLFLAGPAGNLLAPSFAGWKQPDGSLGRAYLTGLSVTYIAALDRLTELEKLAGQPELAERTARRRDLALDGLKLLTTDEGYLINSLDPDGTRHGVYGAPQHGYFETSPNQDAIAFRVVDDAQAGRIFAKIASIPELRPHAFILPNYPSYDDMYEKPEGLWAYGTWVNGGHWSTCEARMVLGYYRLGRFDDARRSMEQLLTFARRFRMDNPLVNRGSEVYQPGLPINLTYDAFGPPAAFVRGLFEYQYQARELTLRPHIPPTITRLEQRFPVRFGSKRLFLATVGTGPVTAVAVNEVPWKHFNGEAVHLAYNSLPDRASIEIALGGARLRGFLAPRTTPAPVEVPRDDAAWKRAGQANLAVNALPLRIGADSEGGNRFHGDLVGARVFSRALGPEEIARLARREAGAPDHDPALVGDWTFAQPDGDGFVSATSPRLRARIVGQAGVVDEAMGKALRLDGGGYLEIAPHPSLDLTEACTLEAWIRPDGSDAAGMRIIDKSQVGTSNGYLLDLQPGNSLRLIASAGTLSHAAVFPTNTWTHVAATVGPGGQLSLYVQGQLLAEGAGPAELDIPALIAAAQHCDRFAERLALMGLANRYEAFHARLVVQCLATAHDRLVLLAKGKLRPLDNVVSRAAADRLYLDTARKVADGLARVMASYETSEDAKQRETYRWWQDSATAAR